MKTKIILMAVLISGFIQINFAQEISEEYKQDIIALLDSADYDKRLIAVMYILDFGITREAFPKLESNIFKQEQDLALWFLRIIIGVKPEETINWTNKFIDSVEYLQRENDAKTINELKTEAVAYQFSEGYYYNAGTVIATVNEQKPNVSSTAFVLLSDILEYVPEYELQAKEELRRVMLNFNDDYYAPTAAISLIDKYGDELIPDLLHIIYNSTSGQMKFIAYDALKARNYPDMENITKYLFLNERDFTHNWLNEILILHNTPSNYKFILDNYQNILESGESTFYTNLFHSNKLNFPLFPPNFTLLTEQIEYIKGLCDTLPQYSWLADNTFANELKAKLTTAKANIQAGDSLACRVQVKAFQDLVDNVYKDSLNTDARFVTIEGWKFLYWNAQYILDRLPEPPANPDLLVSLKTSTGALLTGGSLQYYDTQWKPATSNGDGTFTVTTTQPTVNLKLTYDDMTAEANNVSMQLGNYEFKTVNVTAQLKNSAGASFPFPAGKIAYIGYFTGTVQKSLGNLTSTVQSVSKELLPGSYQIRVMYEYLHNDKTVEVTGTNVNVEFQTISATMIVKDKQGKLLNGVNGLYNSTFVQRVGPQLFGKTDSKGEVKKEILAVKTKVSVSINNRVTSMDHDFRINPIAVLITI